MPSGGVTVFECEAAPKAMRGDSGVSAKMDGVIVAAAHDEFRGMGVGNVRGFAGAVVVDVCSMQGVEGMNIAKVAVERWVPSIRAVNASEQYLKHDDELLIGG